MRILDLFCGAGGAAMGLHQAFPEAEIVGVDIKPQPRYPFTFVQGDVMAQSMEGFNFIWAVQVNVSGWNAGCDEVTGDYQ